MQRVQRNGAVGAASVRSTAKATAVARPNRKLGGYDVTVRIPAGASTVGAPPSSQVFYARDWTDVVLRTSNMALHYGLRGISVREQK